MPPRTRASKTTKSLKENIGIIEKTELKSVGKVTKPTRKALADKTNSGSDDNASIEHTNVVKKHNITSTFTNIDVEIVSTQRPHRARRLPNRFVENHVLNSLSNSKENTSLTPVPKGKTSTPAKSNLESPFKTRPKRLCRFPFNFEDHSPNKSITIIPANSSTPILLNNKNSKTNNKVGKNKSNEKLSSSKNTTEVSKNGTNKEKYVETLTTKPKKSLCYKAGDNYVNKTSADSNNNAKQGRTLRSKRINTQTVQICPRDKSLSRSVTHMKTISPKHKNDASSKKPFDKHLSFRVLNKNQSRKDDHNKPDVYEFTFDPNEEPPPQKKKRKRVVKKPAKPKTVVFKSNYDYNISKALSALRNVVSQKSQQTASNATKATIVETVLPPTSDSFKIPEQNYASVRVEDIAADFELSDHHEINYSPINTPTRPQTPIAQKSITEQNTEGPAYYNNDPLTLRDNISFFDDEPVASSSMNMSVKHPHASPWRVEFQTLPIKWRVNSYVKPNMTPAMECSFVNFDDNKKKHVYTNMVPEDSDPLPKVVQNDEPNLKQTSILSFIKEVVERSAGKKKRDRSTTPNRANLVFDDLTSKTQNKYTDEVNQTPRKVLTPKKGAHRPPLTPIKNSVGDNLSNKIDNDSCDKESSKESQKRKNDTDPNVVPAKTPRKDKDNTFFGFDDSENEVDENVVPRKTDTHRVRDLRPRARAVLKEINAITGPSRAMLPLAAKSALNSEAVTKFNAEKKLATDAAEKSPVENVDTTNAHEALGQETVVDEDSQSVHLFEDIEVIHHLKPTRKSYGKAKKVTFRQHSFSNSDIQDSDLPRLEREDSGEEDDLADLTFEIPTVKEKKVTKKKMTKKQKLSKKEKREADVWAAGFNSMCADVEDFPLVVE